jgi:hypothetical protein
VQAHDITAAAGLGNQGLPNERDPA